MLAVIFSSESPNCASAAHAAEFVQRAVPLGITQISWGTITKLRCPICSQKAFVFRNLASIVPTTHLLKITAHLLLTYYSISYQYLYCSKQITLHQSITEGEFLFTPIVTCLRSKSCTSVVKLSITKNWDIKKLIVARAFACALWVKSARPFCYFFGRSKK